MSSGGSLYQMTPVGEPQTISIDYQEEDGTRVIRTEIITRSVPIYNLLALSELTPFQKEFLDQHNEYRALHGVAPLQMSRDVNLKLFFVSS